MKCLKFFAVVALITCGQFAVAGGGSSAACSATGVCASVATVQSESDIIRVMASHSPATVLKINPTLTQNKQAELVKMVRVAAQHHPDLALTISVDSSKKPVTQYDWKNLFNLATTTNVPVHTEEGVFDKIATASFIKALANTPPGTVRFFVSNGTLKNLKLADEQIKPLIPHLRDMTFIYGTGSFTIHPKNDAVWVVTSNNQEKLYPVPQFNIMTTLTKIANDQEKANK